MSFQLVQFVPLIRISEVSSSVLAQVLIIHYSFDIRDCWQAIGLSRHAEAIFNLKRSFFQLPACRMPPIKVYSNVMSSVSKVQTAVEVQNTQNG